MNKEKNKKQIIDKNSKKQNNSSKRKREASESTPEAETQQKTKGRNESVNNVKAINSYNDKKH